MQIRNIKGIGLIALVILLIFASMVILGTANFVVQGVKLNTVQAGQTKAIYLARAGICAAIVDYRDDNLWNDVSGVSVTGNQYYSVGEETNFLLIDASSPSFRGNNKILDDLVLTNVNESDDIQLSAITIGWSPDEGEVLTKINFGGGGSEWSGSADNGEEISLSHTFASQDSCSFELTFGEGSIDMSGKTITAAFVFSDGSERRMDLLVSGAAGNSEFSLKATGEVRTDPTTWRRTLVATYDAGTGNITSWREVYDHLD